MGFEPTPTLVDQNSLWLRISGASLETWVWRVRPLGHPDSRQNLCLLHFTSFCFLNNVEINISFKQEKYIRLERTQQSLLTSHVSAPSDLSWEESKWTYAGWSNEWIFCQFRTFDSGEVFKGFRARACFCSVAVITCALRAQVRSWAVRSPVRSWAETCIWCFIYRKWKEKNSAKDRTRASPGKFL